jgi:hypothetical protein
VNSEIPTVSRITVSFVSLFLFCFQVFSFFQALFREKNKMAAVRFFFALFFAVTAAHVDPVKPLTFPVSPLQVDLMTTQDVAAMYDVLTKSDAKSLLKKCLTQDVFDQLKDKKTSKGATLADVIRSGVVNLDSGVGVYAPDGSTFFFPFCSLEKNSRILRSFRPLV